MNPRDLPYGAKEIAELRTIGKRPADMVLVSLVGPLRESNPVIVTKPERAYDWRFLVGLAVAIVAKTDTPNLAGVVKAIEAANPASLSVWFADRQDGINLRIGRYQPDTKTGRRIGVCQRAAWAGLGSERPAGECLALIACETKQRAMQHSGHVDPAMVEMAHSGLKRIFGQSWEIAA